MGLLDEAIREHLELKRSHGADPGEVARAEREALGPVRAGGDLAREPHADPLGPEAGVRESDTSDGPPLGESDDAAGLYDDETTAQPPDASPSSDIEPPYQRDNIAVAGQETAEYDFGTSLGTNERVDPLDGQSPLQTRQRPESAAPTPSPAAPEADRASDGSSGAEPTALGGPGATAGPDEPPTEPSAGESVEHPPDEDVLEETPEFLQQTPEHEGLWFEQRPPRDFDFGR